MSENEIPSIVNIIVRENKVEYELQHKRVGVEEAIKASDELPTVTKGIYEGKVISRNNLTFDEAMEYMDSLGDEDALKYAQDKILHEFKDLLNISVILVYEGGIIHCLMEKGVIMDAVFLKGNVIYEN